jgi:hypothetical protein
MNITEITKAIAPLVKLVEAEGEKKLIARHREFEIERTEFKRKLKYIEAQRDKWKEDALKYRKQVIMFRTEQRKKK